MDRLISLPLLPAVPRLSALPPLPTSACTTVPAPALTPTSVASPAPVTVIAVVVLVVLVVHLAFLGGVFTLLRSGQKPNDAIVLMYVTSACALELVRRALVVTRSRF